MIHTRSVANGCTGPRARNLLHRRSKCSRQENRVCPGGVPVRKLRSTSMQKAVCQAFSQTYLPTARQKDHLSRRVNSVSSRLIRARKVGRFRGVASR